MTANAEKPAVEGGEKDSRFREGEGGTVIDAVKRLMWCKRDTWQMTGKWMSLVQVRDYAAELNRKRFAGHSSWRVPTAGEVKSLYDKSQQNKDHMGQMVPHPEIFDSGFCFLYWTADVRNKVQGMRFGFRKGMPLYDDIYRTSRGSTRLVRDIEKEEGVL